MAATSEADSIVRCHDSVILPQANITVCDTEIPCKIQGRLQYGFDMMLRVWTAMRGACTFRAILRLKSL